MGDVLPERPRTSAYSLHHVLRASDDVLELLPVAVCICDLQGRIVQYNNRAVEIWGRKPEPGDTHEHFTSPVRFFTSDGTRLPESRLNHVLRTGLACRNEEVVVHQPDGSRIAVLVNIDPLVDSQGRAWSAW